MIHGKALMIWPLFRRNPLFSLFLRFKWMIEVASRLEQCHCSSTFPGGFSELLKVTRVTNLKRIVRDSSGSGRFNTKVFFGNSSSGAFRCISRRVSGNAYSCQLYGASSRCLKNFKRFKSFKIPLYAKIPGCPFKKKEKHKFECSFQYAIQ